MHASENFSFFLLLWNVFKGGPLANTGLLQPRQNAATLLSVHPNLACPIWNKNGRVVPTQAQNAAIIRYLKKLRVFIMCTTYTLMQEKFLWMTFHNSAVIYEEIKLHFIHMYVYMYTYV